MGHTCMRLLAVCDVCGICGSLSESCVASVWEAAREAPSDSGAQAPSESLNHLWQ